MFTINDTVKYGNNGIFRIIDVRMESFGGGEKKLYYVLKKDHDGLTAYCPVETANETLHKLLSKEEIYRLIKTMPETDGIWIEDDRKRSVAFGQILKEGDHKALVGLIKMLYFKKEEKTKGNKKLHIADEKAMKEAERILYEEFAHVLNISQEEVLPFIMGIVEKA
ncbi:MAG: CarD family transcriptional regulator [Ruminococcaceae bacterium]|nr:CarD family transcriptional regulator [Oscillospiraceae bacterium]